MLLAKATVGMSNGCAYEKDAAEDMSPEDLDEPDGDLQSYKENCVSTFISQAILHQFLILHVIYYCFLVYCYTKNFL